MSEEIITIEEANNGNKELSTAPAFVRDAIKEAGMYISIPNPESQQSKVILYQAMNSSKKIKDIDKAHAIHPVGMIIRPDYIESENDGTIMAPAVVLVDDSGETYMSHASGILTSAKNLISIFGEPSEWDDNMVIWCEQAQSQRGRYYHFLQAAFV